MLPYCWAGLLLVGAFVSAGFTPGPWSVGVVRFAGRTQLVCAYGKGFVCEVESPVRDGEFSHEEREANARLIAAAPELYAAVEGVVAWIDGDYADDTPEGRRIMAAKLALAKARGEL
jgi:hypothetical protein